MNERQIPFLSLSPLFVKIVHLYMSNVCEIFHRTSAPQRKKKKNPQKRRKDQNPKPAACRCVMLKGVRALTQLPSHHRLASKQTQYVFA
jgi:hypothetical protein